MNILIDARSFIDPNAGGVTKFALGVVDGLLQAMPNDRFTFITTGMHRPNMKDYRATHRHVTVPNKLWSLTSMLRMVSLDRVSTDQPDLLFLPNLGFVGRPRIPYMLLVHDISFLIEPRWFKLRGRIWHHAVHARRLIKEAKHLFAVSERTKQDLITQVSIPAERITVIPIGLDHVEPFAKLPPTLEGKRFVLAMGYGNPRKNAGCAIAAVDALRRSAKFSDVSLILIGRDLKRPSDAAVITLMKHASAFLYPSWYEGFGIPLHEAARFGTPCIASTASVLPETAPQGTLFASPAKPHEWTKALEIILHTPGEHRTSTTLGDWLLAGKMIRHQIM